MEFNEKENVLKVNGKVYDVVERKVEYEKGVWYLITGDYKSMARFYGNIDGYFVADITFGDCKEINLHPEGVHIHRNCKIEKAATEDFLSFGYRLLRTKQPWDGEEQEFLVKDRDIVLAWDNNYEVSFNVMIYSIGYGDVLAFSKGSTCSYDNYLQATPENIEKMTEWMKSNLK